MPAAPRALWNLALVALVGVLVPTAAELPDPYPPGRWGRRRQAVPLDDGPAYEVTPIADYNEPLDVMNGSRTQGFHDEYQRITVKGHKSYDRYNGLMYVVPNPFDTFSVKPPLHGCGNGTYTPKESANGQCLVATNAGFFDTHTSVCHGTVVSDGETVHQTDEMNVSFGVTEDGEVVVGYLTEEEKLDMNFRQLVNGVIWLVRNGTKYIDESIGQEDMETQETGCTNAYSCYFRTVDAARLALGHDADGRVVMLAMDGAGGFTSPWGGWIGRTGVDLDLMADLLIEAGVVNAINLDGGGSVGVFEDGILVNSPSDKCKKEQGGYEADVSQVCARRVSSILCVHEPDYGVTDSPPTPWPPTPLPPTPIPPTPVPTPEPTEAPTDVPTPTPATGVPTPVPLPAAPRGNTVVIVMLFIVALFLLIHLVVYIGGQRSCAACGDASSTDAGRPDPLARAAPRLPAYRNSGRSSQKKLRRKRGSRYQNPQRALVDLELVGISGYESSSGPDTEALQSQCTLDFHGVRSNPLTALEGNPALAS